MYVSGDGSVEQFHSQFALLDKHDYRVVICRSMFCEGGWFALVECTKEIEEWPTDEKIERLAKQDKIPKLNLRSIRGAHLVFPLLSGLVRCTCGFSDQNLMSKLNCQVNE